MVIIFNSIDEFNNAKELLQVLPGDLYIGTPNISDDGRVAIDHPFTDEQLQYVKDKMSENSITLASATIKSEQLGIATKESTVNTTLPVDNLAIVTEEIPSDIALTALPDD